MATIANLNILLTLDDQVSKGIDKSRTALLAWGESIRNTGSLLTDNVTRPVLDFISGSVNAASDLAEATSAVEEVYGSAADVVIQRSNEAAAAVGLSRDEYLSTATVLGVYGDTLGTSALETAKFSDSLITAAADLGSFYNANTPEVLGAMQAALRGEFDPLERFGIMMNMAALEQHALEEGIWDGNGALTNQQRILAAHSFIMDRMGSAAGDFARTSNGLANSQKILRAQLRNVAAQMGQVLLPTMTKLVTMLRELTTRFQGIPENWQRWIVYIALAAAAVGPLLVLLGTLMTLLPAIGAALAVLTGPIGLVAAAIALLTAAYLGNWWGFRDAVDGVAGSVAGLVAWLGSFETVRSTVSSAVDAIVGLFDRITDAVGKTGRAILAGEWRTALAGIGDMLAAPAKAVGEFIKGLTTPWESVNRVLTLVGSQITGFGRLIQEVFQGDVSGALDVLQRMVERVPEIFVAAFNAIPWSSIGAAIVTAIQALPGLITNAATVLHAKGGELLTGLIDGVGSAIPGLTALLSVLWSVAQTAVGDLTSTLLSKGKQLLGGLWSGWNAVWTTFSTTLGNLGTTVASAIGDVTGHLLQKGKDLMGGVMTGWSNRFATAKVSIGLLGTAVAMAVGDVASSLYQKGVDLVQGLIDGLLSKLPGLQTAADIIARTVGAAVELINKISSPSRLMMEYGGYMTEGLAIGIRKGLPEVQSAANAMSAAASIGVGVNGDSIGAAGGGFNNYGIYNAGDRYWAPEQSMRSRELSRNRR